MRIGVPKEVHAGEKRVATTPEVAGKLKKLGFTVAIETGAGESSNFSDADFQAAGCEIVKNAADVWTGSDLILKVRAPESHPLGGHEAEWLKAGQTLICFIWPGQNSELMKKLAATRANVLAMDSVPRISRAQKLDALSSMANIAGYRAVIEAAHHFGRFFTGQITAAGKVPPAKVLVIGAGVAGLAAIGAASGLGAVVRGFDTRPEVKEQVQSMGAEFLELDFKEEGSGGGGYAKQMSEEFIKAEMALFADQAKDVDIIITTALIPGKRAPLLITADMVKSMKSGSVIVDMAAEQGGNCELTEPGQVAVKHGVTLIGYTDLPSRLAKQSSQLYGSNLWRLIEELCPQKNGQIHINMEDEVIRGTTVIREGEITWPPPPVKVSAAPAKPDGAAPAAAVAASAAARGKAHKGAAASSGGGMGILAAMAAAILLVAGQFAPPAFLAQLTVFILACFVGYMVVWNVKAALHTPLMSVTNAISGIIAVGAVLQISSPKPLVAVLAAVAILISTINIAGGFLVTQRMLTMFKK
jgi:H+-translocating NAD(P) transhydrogenase subunit alpha